MNKKDRVRRDDVAMLQKDIAEAASEAKEEVMAAAHDAFARAQEKIGAAGEQGKIMGKQVDQYVHENSWAAVGIAAGIGLVMGLLLTHRRK